MSIEELLAKTYDELHLRVFPLIVGSGAHLFEGFVPTRFDLMNISRFDSRLAVRTYSQRPKEK